MKGVGARCTPLQELPRVFTENFSTRVNDTVEAVLCFTSRSKRTTRSHMFPGDCGLLLFHSEFFSEVSFRHFTDREAGGGGGGVRGWRYSGGGHFLFLGDHIKKVLWRNTHRENSSHICSRSKHQKSIFQLNCAWGHLNIRPPQLCERYLFKAAILEK